MLPSADSTREQKCDGFLLLLLPWLLIINNALAHMMDVYSLLYMSPSSPHSFTISRRVPNMSNILLKISSCLSQVILHHFVVGQVLDFCNAPIKTILTIRCYNSNWIEIPAAEEKAESNTLLKRLEESSEERVSITLIAKGFNWRAEVWTAWAVVNLGAKNAGKTALF